MWKNDWICEKIQRKVLFQTFQGMFQGKDRDWPWKEFPWLVSYSFKFLWFLSHFPLIFGLDPQ